MSELVGHRSFRFGNHDFVSINHGFFGFDGIGSDGVDSNLAFAAFKLLD
jgi:hypothetical protein